MKNKNGPLEWQEVSRTVAGDFNIFAVCKSVCRSPDGGSERPFSIIETRNWAMALPLVDKDNFLMVKQWRHGAKELSVEFPGGVFEAGESPLECAARELSEETGFIAKKMTSLADVNPNPAIMSNRVHFFLAEDLTDTGALHLDRDEFVETLTVPIKDVARGIGKAPFSHALTTAAFFFFMRHTKGDYF